MTQDEARFVLETILQRETQRLMILMQPYHTELMRIRMREPPSPFVTTDGRVMIYKGPTAEQLGGPYQVPQWMEEIVEADPELAHLLMHYREQEKR